MEKGKGKEKGEVVCVRSVVLDGLITPSGTVKSPNGAEVAKSSGTLTSRVKDVRVESAPPLAALVERQRGALGAQ